MCTVGCLAIVATGSRAQTPEVPGAAPQPSAADPAPVGAPPPSASDAAPQPMASDVPPPALTPIERSFPTPAPAAPLAPAAAEEPAAEEPLGGVIKFKPGKGVDLKSNDGNWALNIRFKGQFLDELRMPTAEDAVSRNYLFVRRQRVAFAGNFFSKDIKYKIEVSFAGQELARQPAAVSGAMPANEMGAVTTNRDVTQQAPLLDLYLDFTQIRDLNLRVGQAKVTYGRERILGDSDLHTVDRSIDDIEFNFDRDLGLELRSLDLGGIDRFRYFLGIYAAEDRNSGLQSLGTGDFGFLYLARLETVPFGSFEETPVDFQRTAPRLSFGIAYALVQTDIISPYAMQSAGAVQPSGGRSAEVDYNVHNFTADFLFKASGFSALGAFHYRKASDLPLTAAGDQLTGADGLGFVLQAHYLFSKETPLAVTGNVSLVRAAGDASTINERSEAGGGVGYYFYDHALKLEAEFEHQWFEAAESPPTNRLRFQLSFII